MKEAVDGDMREAVDEDMRGAANEGQKARMLPQLPHIPRPLYSANKLSNLESAEDSVARGHAPAFRRFDF